MTTRFVPAYVKMKILTKQGGTCASCPKKTELTVDHILPISEGGNSSEENLQVLCWTCHSKKNRERYSIFNSPISIHARNKAFSRCKQKWKESFIRRFGKRPDSVEMGAYKTGFLTGWNFLRKELMK